MKVITDIRSPNFELRPAGCGIKFIILHYTEMVFKEAVERLCNTEAKVSAHYVVHKNGDIYNLVDDVYRAWHAGKSYWSGLEDINSYSIGIEIDNMGDELFPDAQMQAVISCCKYLMKKYDIPRENVLGHSDIAPDRKKDPGRLFDWKLLDRNEIGISMEHNIDGLTILEKQKYLQNMGYKIEVTGQDDDQMKNVEKAFRDHFYR